MPTRLLHLQADFTMHAVKREQVLSAQQEQPAPTLAPLAPLGMLDSALTMVVPTHAIHLVSFVALEPSVTVSLAAARATV